MRGRRCAVRSTKPTWIVPSEARPGASSRLTPGFLCRYFRRARPCYRGLPGVERAALASAGPCACSFWISSARVRTPSLTAARASSTRTVECARPSCSQIHASREKLEANAEPTQVGVGSSDDCQPFTKASKSWLSRSL